jgi:hypothetical protein
LFLLGASSCFLDFVQHHVRSCNCADQKTRSIIDPGFQNCVYTAFLKKDNSAMCTGLSPGTASFPLLSCMHASSITNVTSPVAMPPSLCLDAYFYFILRDVSLSCCSGAGCRSPLDGLHPIHQSPPALRHPWPHGMQALARSQQLLEPAQVRLLY